MIWVVGLIIAIVIVLALIGYVSQRQIKKEISNLNTENILIEENKINLSSLTLRQKISQMIMVRGDKEDLNFVKLNVGGIFLDRQDSEENYKNLIEKYQENSKIKLLVSTDLEGAWTPFPKKEASQISIPFSEIKDSDEAYEIGLAHGELLKRTGFNLNFAPVAEFRDEVYGGRAFLGDKEEVKEKIVSYIKGLQKKVLGTCKHYPGKGMIKNLHFRSDRQNISKEDLELFDACLKENISSIMVSHQIVEGEVDSGGKPSSVSREIIKNIDDSVLIVSDEINMRGLKNFYILNKRGMYADLINSGENLILDFDLDSVKLDKLIKKIEIDVRNGKVSEEEIDKSVRKILMKKGYTIT